MAAKLRSWWQNIQKPLAVTGLLVGCLLLMGLLGVVVLVYVFQVNVPGLQGKTLWDWFQLLIIPAVLAVGGSLFTFTTTRIGQEAARQRDQTERELTGDNQREAALQSYMDSIAELLLEKHLRESHPADEVRTIARVLTLTTLPRLDGARKGSVLHFLHEAGLIEQGQSLIALSDADLSGANLCGADLSDADLSGADLSGADLSDANLGSADMCGADLSDANLCGANLCGADLSDANLSGANLSDANLGSADLSDADMSEANLDGANLSDADLDGANLSKVILSDADLSGADITRPQLNGTRLLQDVVLQHDG